MDIVRDRKKYSVLIIAVIILGLCSRKLGHFLPGFIKLYSGDTLWGLMVFLVTGFILKKEQVYKVALIAALFSIFIETSQLYHSAWIDALRNTLIGGLVLGYGFLWSDIICYILGISLGVVFEKSFIGFLSSRKNI